MSARVYSVAGTAMTIANSNPVTLAFVHSGTSASLIVIRAWVSQVSGTAQQLGVQLSTQVTAFPTLTSATPQKIGGGTTDPASVIAGGSAGAAGTSGVNASAEGAGAKTVLYSDGFNNQNGWLWVPTPEERIILPASSASGLGVVLLTTASTLTGWNAGIVFQEI